LLESSKYSAWKNGASKFLWLHGGAGYGKTILCSTVVQDIGENCAEKPEYGHATSYFAFSDQSKQTYENMLISLVAQLGSREPGFTMLKNHYDSRDKRKPGREEQERILRASLARYNTVFCHFDAADECPEANEERQRVLRGIEDIVEQSPNVRILITSRDETNIRHCMEQLDTASISIATGVVDADIKRYITTQMNSSSKLSRLDLTTKRLVEETLSHKADGM
jgi:hypothetical protein